MYRWINARNLSGEVEIRETDISLPDNAPYGVEDMKKLIFLHGANVTEADAEFWGEQLFKRFWHTGCNVDFYNVDWRSDMGTDANYQQNASNAFDVASRLVNTIANIPGEKVIMAHSLGNMVVSSMMQDYGLEVSAYMMCDSAVPSEAYDPSVARRIPQLVHPEWTEYPTNSWASNWHTLFDSPDDDRGRLGWPGRFPDVAAVAVNFYSTGDEVLEIHANNNLSVFTGVSDSLGHLSWHKQELFKGRADWTSGLGGTDWSGWSFRTGILGDRLISSAKAANMGPADFKTNTVFRLQPTSMATNEIHLLVRAAHLTQGIPALAPATGYTSFPPEIMDPGTNFNLDSIDEQTGIPRPNGWPQRNVFEGQWLHSDMKDVSYYYNYNFYEKIKDKGGL